MNPKETFEAAAKKYSGLAYDRNDYEEIYYYQQGCTKYDAFIEGAKWQAERSYSEEDMRECVKYILRDLNSHNEVDKLVNFVWIDSFNKWFEQFKK